MTGIESMGMRSPVVPSAEETSKLNRELFGRFEELFQKTCGVSTTHMIKATPSLPTGLREEEDG